MHGIDVTLSFLAALSMLNLIVCDPCYEINSHKLPRYKLMKSSARLNQFILARTTVRNVNECKKFALAKKALAFNYGVEIDHYGTDLIEKESNINVGQKKNETRRKMCQALQCSEVHNLTTLVRDKNFKYYSIYPSFVAIDSDSTLLCVPRAGIFSFSNNTLNYSQAQTVCQKMNGSLAHIISEERTNELAKYILQDTPTFIGLSSRDGNGLWKNEFDEPLTCFNYRAWGKGEPSHSKGCVSLVQPSKSEPGPFWKVVPCDGTLPFLCEISPIY